MTSKCNPRFAIIMTLLAPAILAQPAKAVDMSPELKALVAAAAKEGEVNVSWGASTLGGPNGAKLYQEQIKKTYGVDLKVNWTPGPSMPNMGNQVAMRFANGLPAPTDVYMGFSRNYAVLKKHKLFLSAPWRKFLPGRITDEIVEQDNTLVKMISTTVGYTYNTKLAPSVPARIADFLKPEWKGKVATTPYAAGFDQMAAKEGWGPDRTIDYAKKLTNQLAGFIRCSDSERLSSGEFLALIFDCSGDSMAQAIEKGAPLKRVISIEVPIVSYFYLSVPKNSKNPNAAQLLIVHLSSSQGQAAIRKLTSGEVHLYPDSELGKELKTLEKQHSVKFVNADVEWQLANKAGNAAQRATRKILRSARK